MAVPMRRFASGRKVVRENLTSYALHGQAEERKGKIVSKYGRGSGPWMAFEAGRQLAKLPNIVSAEKIDSSSIRCDLTTNSYVVRFAGEKMQNIFVERDH